MIGSCRPIAFKWIAACSLMGLSVSHAHPISLSSAIVDVKPDRVEAKLEIMVEDLVLYHELTAGVDGRYTKADLSRAAQEHCQFLTRYFTFRNGDGMEIPVQAVVEDSSEITEEGVDQSEVMLRSVRYQLSARMNRPLDFLTVMQQFGGPEAVLPAVMDLMLLQNGVLLERPVQISHGRPHTVQFNWENPPQKLAGGLAGLRRQYEEQFRKRLGITSYGGLYSYLYVTGFEVRHEILVPLLTFEQWQSIAREDPEFIEVDEQAAARESIERFFQERCSIRINEQFVSPRVSRIQFFGLEASDFAINAPARRLSAYQARLGVILRYRSDDPVERIGFQWSLFNDFAPFLRTVVIPDQDDTEEHLFGPDDSQFVWQRKTPVDLPRIQPASGNSAALDPSRRHEVVRQLLVNVYRAFEFNEDSDVYDSLAASASKDFLPDLYLQIKRDLVMAEQGGDLSRLSDLEVASASIEGRPGSEKTRYRCRWQVEGSVEHWGHIHRRVNQYDAILELQPEDGWIKLAGLQLVEARSVEVQTLLRRLGRPDPSQRE